MMQKQENREIASDVDLKKCTDAMLRAMLIDETQEAIHDAIRAELDSRDSG